MFDTTPTPRRSEQQIDARTLATLNEQARPISASQTQLLPVLPPLWPLLPERGLRRGSTIGVTAQPCGGGSTLALALVAAASMAGSWCTGVGLPDLGALAADELHLDLRHLAFVPWPGAQWADAVAAAIEGVDVVLLRPPPHVRAHLVRRLVARLRNCRAVLIVLTAGTGWSDSCDVELRVDTARWVSVGWGEDFLRARLAIVTANGRGAANRAVQCQLWLPDKSHAIATA
jgi:hypothetical protein